MPAKRTENFFKNLHIELSLVCTFELILNEKK